MTDLESCLDNLGGLQSTMKNPLAAPAGAPSALSSDLGSKAPLGFAPSHSQVAP